MRDHTDSSDLAVSVDQHGVQSAFHDPPFTRPNVKRIRSASGSAPKHRSSTFPAQPPRSQEPGLDAATISSASHGRTLSDELNHSSTSRPPDHAISPYTAPKRSLLTSHPDVPTGLLVDFLTSSDTDTVQHIRAHFSSDFHRIDAYLLLRERDPQRLSVLSYLDIYSLIRRAGKYKLGSVLGLILDDIVGPYMSNNSAMPGYFNISPGTEERFKLLREILVRCIHAEFLLHDGTAMNVFMLMLDDQIQLRQASASAKELNPDASSASLAAMSIAEGAAITLPDNFPVGEARRLAKLAVHLHSPELAPVLNALRAHLEAHTPDFPTAREGSQLIAYYLQPNLREFGAALDVVRGLRDTNAVAQEVIDDAIHDGKAYLSELERTMSADAADTHARPSAEELQQICLDVSLRLIAMKNLMAQRPKGGVQYRKAFESLIASFRLDMFDMDGRFQTQSLLDVPVRSIRNVFLHLVGQNDKSCLVEALFVLQRAQRCDQRLVAMLPDGDLQQFCDFAQTNDALSLAAEAYTLFVKAKASTASTPNLSVDYKHVLARDGMLTDTDTFLTLMRQLVLQGQKINMIALLRAMRLLPLTDTAAGQLNMRFSGLQRSRMVALLAEVGLAEDAFELYQHWTLWRYEAAALADSVTLRRAGAVQVADPLIERQIRLMHDPDQQVAISSECLVALVRSLCRQPAGRSASHTGMQTTNASAPTQKLTSDQKARSSKIPAEQLSKARFVIDVFKQSCTPMDWTHYRLTALARACFTAKDLPGAFDALAKISFLREIPDQVDIAVLLGGLVEHDVDRAVDLFIRHCSVPETLNAQDKTTKGKRDAKHIPLTSTKKLVTSSPKLAPMMPTPALTSMLLARTIAQNRLDLMERLYEFSEAVGISSRLGHAASLRAVFLQGVPPRKATQTIDRMLANGWIADPPVLEQLAQRLLRKLKHRISEDEAFLVQAEEGAQHHKSKRLSARERLKFVQAATHLMLVSARNKDVINLRTVSGALDVIARAHTSFIKRSLQETTDSSSSVPGQSRRAVRQRDQGERSLQWVTCLDLIVYMLRWTKYLDTGDDYRHSQPLWKWSEAGNGDMISADLDDMLGFGFSRSHNRRTLAQTSAPAVTLPTSTESATDSNADNDAEVIQTDSIVQRHPRGEPNVISADLFRRLIETYLALGDACGAAEVACWMRDEAKIDIARTSQETIDFVSRIKAAVMERGDEQMWADPQANERFLGRNEAESGSSNIGSSNILRMLAGQQSTAHTKRWWTP
nr:putative protein [Melanopsichium pennsylvanicum 4]